MLPDAVFDCGGIQQLFHAITPWNMKLRDDIPLCSRLFLWHPVTPHAEYPAFSIWENFSPDTAGHMVLIPIYADCYLARRQPIRTVVYPRVLNRQRHAARQLLFVEDNASTLAWLVTSNLASKNNTLSWLSTLLCRRRHHASEVQQPFSTRSLSDVSCGKVRSLTEWRNTPGKPGW
jgi:hypothetical protein